MSKTERHPAGIVLARKRAALKAARLGRAVKVEPTMFPGAVSPAVKIVQPSESQPATRTTRLRHG